MARTKNKEEKKRRERGLESCKPIGIEFLLRAQSIVFRCCFNKSGEMTLFEFQARAISLSFSSSFLQPSHLTALLARKVKPIALVWNICL